MNKIEREQRLIVIKQLYEEGYTSLMIANKLGLDPKLMNYYVKRYNITPQNKQRRIHCNDSYFNNIDTEAKAYLLGFFLADGYITEKRRIYLNNSIDDISFIELFQKEIAPEAKIHILNKQLGVKNRKSQGVLRISSQEMYNTLSKKYNITSNKTYDDKFIFNFDLIPKELHRHFIRGYFDGDGSISFILKDNKMSFNFSFIFTSIEFCKQISELFEINFEVKSRIREIKGKTTNWFTLSFNYNRNACPKILKIYEYFYNNSNYYLERKKLKFDNYLKYRAKL